MSDAITELGGLHAAEIDLRILRSKVEMAEMLDEKLGSLREDINLRMDKHEDTVTTRLDTQDEKLAEVLSVVKSIESKGDGWHQEDLAYRRSNDSRFRKIEDVLGSLKLWVSTFRAMAVLRRSTVFVVKEGKPFLVAIAAVCSAWVTIIQFIHTVYPEYVHPWVMRHFH